MVQGGDLRDTSGVPTGTGLLNSARAETSYRSFTVRVYYLQRTCPETF